MKNHFTVRVLVSTFNFFQSFLQQGESLGSQSTELLRFPSRSLKWTVGMAYCLVLSCCWYTCYIRRKFNIKIMSHHFWAVISILVLVVLPRVYEIIRKSCYFVQYSMTSKNWKILVDMLVRLPCSFFVIVPTKGKLFGIHLLSGRLRRWLLLTFSVLLLCISPSTDGCGDEEIIRCHLFTYWFFLMWTKERLYYNKKTNTHSTFQLNQERETK